MKQMKTQALIFFKKKKIENSYTNKVFNHFYYPRTL
jgi:hypothetical protein